MKPESRSYPERPIVGVGVVVWRDDRVLLIRRGKPPGLGQWSLPGGAQQLGETVHETARREVMEETGLHIHVTGLIDVVDGIHRDSDGRVEYHYTLIDLAATAVAGEAVAADDAQEAAWFAPETLATLGLWSETERIIRASENQRRR